jgi:hypothetical protein
MSDAIEVRHFNGRMETPTGRDARVAARDDWKGSGYFEIIRLLMLAGFVLLCIVRPACGDDIFKATGRYAISADHYVVMFTRASCGPCHAYITGGKLDRLKLRFPVTVIHAEQNTQWKHLSVPTFWLARRSDRKVLTRYTGSTDVSIFVTEIDRLTKPQIKQKVQSTQDLIKLHDHLHNQASGLNTYWTYPGDIRTHLRSFHHVSL